MCSSAVLADVRITPASGLCELDSTGSGHSITEPERSGVTQQCGCQESERFFRVCARLGMSGQAPKRWATVHTRPHVICTAYFFAVSLSIIAASIIYGGGFSWFSPKIHIPFLVFVLTTTFLAAWIWREGPLVNSSAAYKVMLNTSVASIAYLVGAAFIGPITFTPFASRLGNIFGAASQLLLTFCTASLGGSSAEMPQTPHQSLWTPLTFAGFTSLRFLDVLTDMGFARILLEQVSPCCMLRPTSTSASRCTSRRCMPSQCGIHQHLRRQRQKRSQFENLTRWFVSLLILSERGYMHSGVGSVTAFLQAQQCSCWSAISDLPIAMPSS